MAAHHHPAPLMWCLASAQTTTLRQWPPSSRIQQIGPQFSNQSWAASLRDLMQRLRTSESNFVSAIPCFSSNSNGARAEETPFEPSAVPYIGDAAPVEDRVTAPGVRSLLSQTYLYLRSQSLLASVLMPSRSRHRASE